MTQSAMGFSDLLAAARYSAVHLELRDSYDVPDEAEAVERFRLTGESDLDPESEYWRDWTAMVREATARGVVIRRARIVSEPVTLYTRYLHAMTPVYVTAGEQVRWLARRNACDLALPGSDFWLFDDRGARFTVTTSPVTATRAPPTPRTPRWRSCAPPRSSRSGSGPSRTSSTPSEPARTEPTAHAHLTLLQRLGRPGGARHPAA